MVTYLDYVKKFDRDWCVCLDKKKKSFYFFQFYVAPLQINSIRIVVFKTLPTAPRYFNKQMEAVVSCWQFKNPD